MQCPLRSRSFILALGSVVFGVLGAVTAGASITGMISGVITDPTGSVLPGVTVVATNADTAVQTTSVADGKGFYSFPSLAVGKYDVAVSHPGFRDFVEKGVTIDVNSDIRLDVKLLLGTVNDTIAVQSDALQIETQSTQMGDVIEGSQITAMPLNGRSYLDLLALQPGVNPYQGDSTTGGGEGVQSINGGRPNSNGFMVNGADAEEKLQNGPAEANGQVVNGTRTIFGNNFGSNPFTKTAASSSYNSFQASLKHKDKYATVFLAYTYSKSIDNGSGLADPTNPYDPALSRGLSIFDLPQDFVASYTVPLPFDRFAGDGDLAKRFTAGWAITGISTFASGQPVTLSESDDNSLSGTFGGPIDVPSLAGNGGSLYVRRNPRNQLIPYFNPNYFTTEPLGQVGNAMRRFFPGPGILNSDMALLKDTAITESTKLQFRAEAFNVFNHAQFNNPSGNVNNTGTGGFGFVTSARDPRIMQVALKLLF